MCRALGRRALPQLHGGALVRGLVCARTCPCAFGAGGVGGSGMVHCACSGNQAPSDVAG